MSERVRWAVGLVAERAAAAAGERVEGEEVDRAVEFLPGEVTPLEVARRVVSGLLEPGEVEAVFGHLAHRVDRLAANVMACGSRDGQLATMFLSQVQCVVLGLALAAGGGNLPAPPVVVSTAECDGSRSCRSGMHLEGCFASRLASPACEQDVWPPAHGGFPGEVRP